MPISTTDLETSLKSRLEELRKQIQKDPLANPVRQLAHELSVAIEKGEIALADLSGLVKALSDDAFVARADYLTDYLDMSSPGRDSSLGEMVKVISDKCADFDAFKAYWQRCRDIVVFTAHPTFILSTKQRTMLIEAASNDDYDLRAAMTDVVHHPDTEITLPYEHEAVLDAIRHGTNALSKLTRLILEEAKTRFPDRWQEVLPAPMRLATWVGYDMDGRNDIGWQDVIKHRLIEKRLRLGWYKSELDRLADAAADLSAIQDKVQEAYNHTDKAVNLFAIYDETPKALAAAADHLTEGSDGKLTSMDSLLAMMDDAIAAAGDDTILELIALKSSMKAFGFGAGEIHFRLNASQIRNAARNILNMVSDHDLFGRRALQRVEEEIENTEPVEVNFASLAIEKSSASRLMIAMAQIFKHIDADQPIRLLIAECENPVTVLACVYLAKQFGVDDKIDICPLFETANALDRSRRILDVLLGQEIFRKYAKGRGRVAIQAGFSDAGRFMGQIPATLAIERLQGHFAQIMDKHGLGDLDAIVFDTHGESMGRGNHQKSFTDRALYALSPWARNEFASRGIHLIQESSYQGGDGYVLFGSDPLAEAVITGLLKAHLAAEKALEKEDLFYEDTATSLDFYRTVKARQEDLFADKAYHATLSAFGLALLPSTGSRKAKRQFEQRSDEDVSLRKVRAIPHNAILQQMGLLANLIGGVGQALSTEQDYFVNLNETSDRFARLMTLVTRAKKLSEIKTMIAYMKLFDGSFWATRPLTGTEHELEKPCAELASMLASDSRYFSALQLAARLRSDSIALGQSLAEMDLLAESSSVPVSLDVLHAVRIALIQHLFILVAKLPTFSPQTGHSKQDVIEMVFHLNVPAAADLLREIFPVDAPSIQDYSLKEGATYPDTAEPRYNRLRNELIEPMEETYALMMRITNGISHYFGAIG